MLLLNDTILQYRILNKTNPNHPKVVDRNHTFVFLQTAFLAHQIVK